MTAQIRAFRYAMTHREETLALAREATGAKADDPRPAFIYEEGLKPGVVDPEFSIPVENLVWIQDQMIALGQLAKAGDIGKLIYPDDSQRSAGARRQMMREGDGSRPLGHNGLVPRRWSAHG